MSGAPACRCCGAALPAPFLDLGRTPLANAYLPAESNGAVEPFYPLAVACCGACHLVQLTETVDPGTLFGHYLYFSSFSDTMLAHARALCGTLVERLKLGPDSTVVEVGSNDGYLLRFFQEHGVRVLGVEPAANIASEAERRGVSTLNRFFGPACVPEVLERAGRANLLVGNNVLAHVPAIAGFLSAARDVLAPAGTAVFEFPYLEDLLENVEFDTVYHEHVFYFSLHAIDSLAARAGLEVKDVSRQPIHGGSLRAFLGRPGEGTPGTAPSQLRAREVEAGLTTPDRFAAFGHRVEALKAELTGRLREWKSDGKRVAAYGAPAKGNTLLNSCGIDRELIEFTVDRSPHKQGLLLPGSRIPICPPEALVEARPDYTLILPWNLADEIVRQQGEYRRLGGRFVVPVPRVRVLE